MTLTEDIYIIERACITLNYTQSHFFAALDMNMLKHNLL